MRVLVTGNRGQVGTELHRLAWPAGTALVGCDRDELDITDEAAVRHAVAGFDAVINAAAFTAVDKAESEPDAAFAANADAPGHLAVATAAAGIPLLHISTDYVFDGTKIGRYDEDDPVAPLGVYGNSKAEGEARVRAANPRHLILRTAWVYSAHGGNFVKTMLRLGDERPELRVVDDQHGCPTAARDIAEALRAMAIAAVQPRADCWGTYHWTGGGDTTWHGLACEVFRLQESLTGRRPPRVVAITTPEYPLPAARPANSRLDCAKACRAFGLSQRPWREGLADVVEELLSAQESVAR